MIAARSQYQLYSCHHYKTERCFVFQMATDVYTEIAKSQGMISGSQCDLSHPNICWSLFTEETFMWRVDQLRHPGLDWDSPTRGRGGGEAISPAIPRKQPSIANRSAGISIRVPLPESVKLRCLEQYTRAVDRVNNTEQFAMGGNIVSLVQHR